MNRADQAYVETFLALVSLSISALKTCEGRLVCRVTESGFIDEDLQVGFGSTVDDSAIDLMGKLGAV